MACFPNPTMLNASAWGTRLNFLMKLTLQKLERWGLLYGENCIILISTIFD